tara:strand:- start:1 stop:195 length:195 start_codon:yes stop_codon:yes gene_type:complete
MDISTVTYSRDSDGNLVGYRLVYDGVNTVPPQPTIVHVPDDSANRHYREIQAWVADGNTIAEPA